MISTSENDALDSEDIKANASHIFYPEIAPWDGQMLGRSFHVGLLRHDPFNSKSAAMSDVVVDEAHSNMDMGVKGNQNSGDFFKKTVRFSIFGMTRLGNFYARFL
jgi:hypothetical protein